VRFLALLASDTTALSAVDAASRAVRRRVGSEATDFVGSSVASLVPPVWSGTGPVPVGWLIPCGTLTEPGGLRVAVVATDAFAASDARFVRDLPADWQR
jgi:hypothetical protein